ncbi:MAG: hypothetical protein GY757_56275 [bacterium]|nr:hypothetical protein [bacterium]
MVEIKDPNKEIDMNELLELVHVPEVKETLFFEFAKLREGILKERIENYYKKRDEYFKELLGEPMTIQEASTARHFGPVPRWFELSRTSEGHWSTNKIIPSPTSMHQYYEILPLDIVDMITEEAPVDIDTVVTRTALYSQHRYRQYDLKFVRASSNHLYGTVQENWDLDKMRTFEELVSPGEAKQEQEVISPRDAVRLRDRKYVEKSFNYYLEKVKTTMFFRRAFMEAYEKHVLPVMTYFSIRRSRYPEKIKYASEEEEMMAELNQALDEEPNFMREPVIFGEAKKKKPTPTTVSGKKKKKKKR